jgi:hypothetical protein
MNTDHIRDIITALKEDKSCVQPWRNYAVKNLQEAIAMIEQGHRETTMKPPGGMLDDVTKPGEIKPNICTCPSYPHAIDKACPVHGR